MRKIIWSDRVRLDGTHLYRLREQGEALFHQWGRDTHSDEDGSFSTAIIELEDGTVKNIPAEQVRFISGELMHKVTIEGSGEPGFDTIKELKKELIKNSADKREMPNGT